MHFLAARQVLSFVLFAGGWLGTAVRNKATIQNQQPHVDRRHPRWRATQLLQVCWIASSQVLHMNKKEQSQKIIITLLKR